MNSWLIFGLALLATILLVYFMFFSTFMNAVDKATSVIGGGSASTDGASGTSSTSGDANKGDANKTA